MTLTLRIKGGTLQEGESLCRTCRWVHMQKGFRESEETIFCDYGPLRRIHFKVAECTDYIDRTVPTRCEMEKIALLIKVEPARNRAGFSTEAGLRGQEVDDDEEYPVSCGNGGTSP